MRHGVSYLYGAGRSIGQLTALSSPLIESVVFVDGSQKKKFQVIPTRHPFWKVGVLGGLKKLCWEGVVLVLPGCPMHGLMSDARLMVATASSDPTGLASVPS